MLLVLTLTFLDI